MEDIKVINAEALIERIIPAVLPEYRDTADFYDSSYFRENLVYTGNDLGVTYHPEGIRVRFWAPMAKSVTLLLFKDADDRVPALTYPMEASVKGTFFKTLPALADGMYYLLEVNHNDTLTRTPGPYAHAVGINGEKGYLLDLKKTDPEGFRETAAPLLEDPVDAVIYEVHVRDLTIHQSSGAVNKGKYLGFAEENTVNKRGHATGLNHIRDLGFTHVQLLPIYDYNCLDERNENGSYNWGYDPLNYNAPEGSYASDAYDPAKRITELKTLIQAVHRNGMGVIMDVVYNHTSDSLESNFHKSVPLYYHRSRNGAFTDASACGNETASERPMTRKFIIDSLLHWVKEYKIDGFRFDLMGIHDIETMKLTEAALRNVKPDIILYGEGWTGGDSPLPEEERLVKRNIRHTPGIGAFSNDMRDGVKGHVFFNEKGGFVSGGPGRESVKLGVLGAVYHPEVNYSDIMYTDRPWAVRPGQSINYVAAHDNLTLYDKLKAANRGKSEDVIRSMSRLSDAIVLLGQGVPFIHAGSEILRTKNGDENSYRSPDSVNAINWDLKTRNLDISNYYKGLISLRKAYPGFRMRTQEEIEKNISFYEWYKESPLKLHHQNALAYVMRDEVKDRTFIIAFNGSDAAVSLGLPKARWDVLADKNYAGTSPLWSTQKETVMVKPYSALVLMTEGKVKL